MTALWNPGFAGRAVGNNELVTTTRPREGAVDPFDVSLEDGELMDEVELTASLIVAANQSEVPLTDEQIDTILGVRHEA
jgi:hypothetical protein